SGGSRALYAASPAGKERLSAGVTGILTLQDVSPGGRALMTHDVSRTELLGRPAGEPKEKDLSWLDWSNASDISPDGKTILFSESGEGGGSGYSVYVRRTDGSPAVGLGEGSAQKRAPDGRGARAITPIPPDPQVDPYPTGAGEAKALPREGLVAQAADWLPDGKQILVTASEPGHGSRLFLREIS